MTSETIRHESSPSGTQVGHSMLRDQKYTLNFGQ